MAPFRIEAPVDLGLPWFQRWKAKKLVQWGILPRFVAYDRKGVLETTKTPEYDNFKDALSDLQFARDTWTLTGADCTGLGILCRLTGKWFSPSPERIQEILDDYCHICGARGEDPCDVGLHG